MVENIRTLVASGGWWQELTRKEQKATFWDNENIYTLTDLSDSNFNIRINPLTCHQSLSTNFTTPTLVQSHASTHSNTPGWATPTSPQRGQPSQPTLPPTRCSGPPRLTNTCLPHSAPSRDFRGKGCSFTLEKTLPFHLSLQRHYDVGKVCHFNPFYRVQKVLNLLPSSLLVGGHSPGYQTPTLMLLLPALEWSPHPYL